MPRLKDFVVKTIINNTDDNQKISNKKEFITSDFVFLESRKEISKFNDDERIILASDYAIMNGASLSSRHKNYNSRAAWYFLRTSSISNSNEVNIDVISPEGKFDYTAQHCCGLSVCPTMQINIEKLLTLGRLKIDEVRDKNGKILYHTIEFGTFPQDKAENSNELEKLYKGHYLTETGKSYFGYIVYNDDEKEEFVNHKEYTYKGKKYVRVKPDISEENYPYIFKTDAESQQEFIWAEVQPIKWKILNWTSLPKEINPNGLGTDKTIFIKTVDGLITGMPFNTNILHNSFQDNMWQNSIIRAYLNGYDIYEEIAQGNGDPYCKALKNYDFKNKNFLKEAFDTDVRELAMNTENQKYAPRRNRLEKLNPDNTPIKARRQMTDTEIIKSWIDAGQSVLLRGPSGIGKTERIKSLYPNLIYIKLTNNMFPEKVVGSTNLQTGESIPPDFAKQALLACATEEEKKLIKENVQNLYDLADTIYERSKSAKGKVVIMLDELLNVKPAVQSLVYTLVLNRLVETGKGLKLPENTVVVATGNQKKYSNVAEDLAEPLEKRFDHILDMYPKVGEWIFEFAIPHKIHPSVIGYIFSKYQEQNKSDNIKDISYFYEEPEVGEKKLDKNGCRGKTNDPRGWESISKTLYAFEEDLKDGKFAGKNVEEFLRVTLRSKLREEWAEEFFDYYNNPTLTVEDVVNKNYTELDYPININEKFALISGLLSATPEQVEVCRKFIKEHCDPEYLAVYDMYWVGNDESRLDKIAELQEQEASEIKEN